MPRFLARRFLQFFFVVCTERAGFKTFEQRSGLTLFFKLPIDGITGFYGCL